MLRPYKFGGGPGKGFSAFWKQKRILPEQNPLSSYLCLVTSLLY